MTKCVIYARVSSKEQEAEGYSIPAQLELFRAYCKQKGLTIVHEFTESESAKTAGRKLFNEMLSFCKANKVTIIVFEKVDRMTRNFKDLVTIYDLMEKHDISIHLIKNGLVLDKNSRSQDKFQLDIHVVLARNYINNLAEETSKGMRQLLLSGGWPHQAPFGYKNVRINGVAKIIPDENNAPIVQEMFAMANNGKSCVAIRDAISDRVRRTFQAVNAILRNEFYIGNMHYKNEIYKGNYEPLIDKDLFYSVQAKITGRRNNPNPKNHAFRFSGLIQCECGAKLYGELKHGKWVTYGCGARIHGKKCTSTGPRYISDKRIIEELVAQFAKIQIDEDEYRQIMAICKTMFGQIASDAEINRKKKFAEVERIETKLTRLLDHYDEQLITIEEYQAHREKLREQLSKVKAELAAYIDIPLDTREKFTLLFKSLVNIGKILPYVPESAEFVNLLKMFITLLELKDGNLRVHWNPIGELMYKQRDHQMWCPTLSNVTLFRELFLAWVKNDLAA